MDTIAPKMPSLSRAKALIGMLLATLAIAGAMEATNPAPVHAAKQSAGYCNSLLAMIELADTFGLTSAGDVIWHIFTRECA
jgi:hypothetical protein